MQGTESRSEEPVPQSRGSGLVRLLRIAQMLAVPVVIGFVGSIVFERVATMHPSGAPFLPAGALACLQCSIVLFALRFRISLWTFGVCIPTRHAARIAMQSLFYFFVPLSAGTEVCRWIKVRAMVPDSSQLAVIASVTFDRLMAALACLVISSTCFFLVDLRGLHGSPTSLRSAEPWKIAIAILFLLAFIVMAMRRSWRSVRVRRLIELGGSRLLRGATVAMTMSIAVQILTVLALWLFSRWLGIELSLAGIALGATGGALAQILPISLAGAGPAEIGSALLFHAAGATPEQAVLLATLLYLCKLVGAIEGGILEWPPISRRLS